LLKTVRHPNIIKYYTSFIENDVLYIIMVHYYIIFNSIKEYARGGDLAQVL